MYLFFVQTIYRLFRGILNKLTPQNAAKLNKTVKDLGINNEERLAGCIDILFEKVPHRRFDISGFPLVSDIIQ